MSMQQINVLSPPARRLAPGTVWAADAIAAFVAMLAQQIAAWRQGLRRRAEWRRRVRGEAELQALAARYMSTQPSFAKELLHAAMNERDA